MYLDLSDILAGMFVLIVGGIMLGRHLVLREQHAKEKLKEAQSFTPAQLQAMSSAEREYWEWVKKNVRPTWFG